MAMTVGTGLLWGVQGGPVPRVEGVSIAPLMSATMPDSIEVIFQTRVAQAPGRWQAIVIHHSGTRHGTAESLAARGGPGGIGGHFVIGNGRGMPSGELYVGHRWLDQMPGQHTAGNDGQWFNQHGIGITLVGDGERDAFTPAQMSRLLELTIALARRYGIPAERVYLHSELAPVADPGRMFPAAGFREQLVSSLGASAG